MPCRMMWLILIMLAAAIGRSEDQQPVPKDISEAIGALEEAFNQSDAKALAACWAAEGEFIGPGGERLIGREKIEAAFRDFLAAHPKAKLQLTATELRLLTNDVALVNLVGEMQSGPRGAEASPFSSAVMVRRDGRWLIVRFRESPGGAATHAARLKQLDWLVGQWTEEDKQKTGISAHSDCHWSDCGKYLIRRFAIEGRRGAALAGTEVIGWDPRTHRVRSWTFNADGSFGESVWTPDDDNQWIVRYTATLKDGGDATATHVIAPVDADTITFQPKERTINGVRQPELPEVTLKRRSGEKPMPAAEATALPERVLP